jgi:hypothetical protein
VSFTRYVLSLGAIVLVVVLGLAGLAQLKFSAFLSDSIGERMEIVGTAAAQDFSAAIDLGLSLTEVANGPQILDRAWDHDPVISAMAVTDLDGAVIHAIGALSGSQPHPDTIAAMSLARADPNEPDWNVEADGQVRTGVLIEGSFGQPVGAVLVHYPTTEMRDQERAMAGELLFDAAWVALALGGAVLVLLRVFRRRAAGPTPTPSREAGSE